MQPLPIIAGMSRAAKADPGLRSTVVGLALGQILSWAALYYAFSSFVLPMQRELHWDKALMMGALTLGLAMWGATTYAVGAAIDRGHGRWVMSGGSLLAGAGFAAWAFISQPWMLYAVWAVLGAAMAMTLYDPAFSVLTKRYPQRYLEGITALTLVGGFASTLSFPAVAALITWLGWRDALLVIAGVLALGVAPLHAWTLRGPAVGAARRIGDAADAADDATLYQALREPAFWLLALSFTLYAFASAALWAHVMPIFASKGFDELQATAVLVWIGPAQVLGRLAYAWVGRGMSLRLLGIAVLLGMPLSLMLLALSKQRAPLLLFALLFGLANGMVTIVRGGLVPEYFGRAHVGRIGGAMSAVGLLARAAAPLLAAWMLLFVPGYRDVLLALAGLGFAAAAAFALTRRPSR
jgi:MFS family permease